MNKTAASSGLFQKIWHFFISVKLTLVVLLCLAATSVIGTLIPQNENPAVYFHQYGEFLYRLFSLLDIFDMYHSWWFQLLMTVLFINIIACSIHRFSSVRNIIFNKNPSVNPTRFRNLENRMEYTADKSPNELEDKYKTLISKRFGFHKIERTSEGFYMFAEKGRLTRLGVYVVHLSVLLMLTGGVIGSLFGFEGFVTIPEGQSVDHIRLKNSNETIPLGFELRCEDFDMSFYESGIPKEYRSRLTILEKGQEILTNDIIVNHPLRFRGINIFQSSYGEIPVERHPVSDLESKKMVLTITNRHTGMAYIKELSIGDTIELPEGGGNFYIREYTPSARFRGQDVKEALIGVIFKENSEPTEVLLPLRYPNFDKMRGGHFVFSLGNIDDLLIAETNEPLYYTGLQITKDPGVWVIYIGFLLMLFGCYVSFFMAHQQIFLEVGALGEKSRILLSGTSNKHKLQTNQFLKKLSKSL